MPHAHRQLKREAPRTRLRLVLLLVFGPLLLGTVVAGLADGFVLTRWVLVLEPLLWLVSGTLALHLLSIGRTAYGTATLVGWLLFAATLRFPVAPQRPDVEVSLATSQCTDATSPMRGALRVVSAAWSTDAALRERLVALGGDIVVISGIPEAEVAPLARALGTEAAPHPPGTALFVRGQVRPCAGAGSVPLPGGFTSLVRLREGDTVPVVALAGAHAADAEGLSAGVRDLASPYTVVVGSTATHGTFRRTEGLLAGARLSSAPHRATWPALVGPVPTLPLYHADRVWVGAGWEFARVHTERLPGADRLALLAEIRPKRAARASP